MCLRCLLCVFFCVFWSTGASVPVAVAAAETEEVICGNKEANEHVAWIIKTNVGQRLKRKHMRNCRGNQKKNK